MPLSGAQPEDRPARSHDPVERLIAILAADVQAVEMLIHDRLNSPVSIIPNVASYLIDAGGKRLRPLITLAAASLFGPVNEAARRLAAAVEFIHTATLLHDDVVDGSGLRRGKAAANAVWGNAASVLVGDFLFSRAFALMVDAGDLATLEVLSRTSGSIAEGEVMQLASVNDVDVPLERYLQIIEAKTAALFSAAARVGAMAAGQTGAHAEALASYGRALGLAFQLIDDALDYGGRTSSLGKNIGDDFREGKLTLPVVFALEHASPKDDVFWRRVMGGGAQQDGDFEHALALFQQHGAMERTLQAARDYADTARLSLLHLPPSPVREALGDLADFVLERAY